MGRKRTWPGELNDSERRELVRNYAIDLLRALAMDERLRAASKPDATKCVDWGDGADVQRDRRRVLDVLGDRRDSVTLAVSELYLEPLGEELRGTDPSKLGAAAAEAKARVDAFIAGLMAGGVLYETRRWIHDAMRVGAIRQLDDWLSMPLPTKEELADPATMTGYTTRLETAPRKKVLKRSQIADVLKTQTLAEKQHVGPVAVRLMGNVYDLKAGLKRRTVTGKDREDARAVARIAAKEKKLRTLELRGKFGAHGSKATIENAIREMRKRTRR